METTKSVFINTLKNDFLGHFSLVLKDAKTLKESLLKSKNDDELANLEKIIKTNSILYQKIDRLLDFYNLDNKLSDDEKTNVNINSLASELSQLVLQQAKEKNIKIKLGLPSQEIHVPVFGELLLKVLYWKLGTIIRHAESSSDIIIAAKSSQEYLKIAVNYKKSDIKQNKTRTIEFENLLLDRYLEIENGNLITQSGKNGMTELILNIPLKEKSPEETQQPIIKGKINIRKVIQDEKELPSLSTIAAKVVSMASNEEVSSNQLAETINKDPALTAKILKVVNSSFYAMRKQITTLSQAITILGLSVVRTLSLCISVLDVFSKGSGSQFDYQEYWERSLASAVASKIISKKLGDKEPEEAFLAGLIQNIGSLIFAKYYPEEYAKVLQEHYTLGTPIIDMEERRWGIDHVEIGQTLLSKWSLPPILVNSISYHHHPEKAENEAEPIKKIVRIVNLSDTIASIIYDTNKKSKLTILREKASKYFQFGQEDIDDIMNSVSQEIETESQSFDISVKNFKNYSEILQEANLELGKMNLTYEQMNRELQKAIAKAEQLAAELQEANKKLKEQAVTDGLTQLYNHRFFFDLLEKEFAKSQRHKLPLSCIMLDIDYFKIFNDTYGHKQGDLVLSEVARILRETVREGDIVARYGGEEFSAILPKTEKDAARVVAERIRSNIENTAFPGNLEKGQVTISLGTSTMKNNEYDTASELVESADQALYKAKENGRNRVESNN